MYQLWEVGLARGRPSRATVYARLEAAIEELNQRLGGLPSLKESEYIWSNIWHLEAHHSTALEGNTLVLREVEELLEKGRAVGAKPLREYMEVQGYATAARQAQDNQRGGIGMSVADTKLHGADGSPPLPAAAGGSQPWRHK